MGVRHPTTAVPSDTTSPHFRPVRTRGPVRDAPEAALLSPAQRLAREIEAEARARRWAPLLRLHPTLFTKRGLRRLVHYVVGSVVLIPPIHLLLTPLGATHWNVQLGLAAAFGVAAGVGRPRGITVGLLLAATALLTMIWTGHVRSLPDLLQVVLALLAYFGLGLALGVTESIVRVGE